MSPDHSSRPADSDHDYTVDCDEPYFLYGLVDKDAVRRANNNLLMRSDELWVFGPTSDGVDVEVTWAQRNNIPVRWFDLDHYGEAITALSARPGST